MIISLNCNIDVNTTDPQSSLNIQSSKSNSFFLHEYIPQKIPGFFTTQQAWIENVWFNKLSNGRKGKYKSEQKQLVLKIVDFSNLQFSKERSLIYWRLKDNTGKVLGQSHGNFVLHLENSIIPDSVRLIICNIQPDRTTNDVAEFMLTSKN